MFSPLLKNILCDVAVVLLAFAVSWILVYDISSLSYFAPFEKNSDFSSTDFYQVVSDNRAVRIFNDDVVIVPIDGLSREEITDVLELISVCEPATVGVDIVFGFPQPDDERLVSVLSELPDAVVPDTSAYIYSSCRGLTQGSVYFEAKSYRSTIRDCRSEGTFAAELARLYRPGLKLPETMHIEYPSMDFNVVQADELLDYPELIEGKIVLVGAVSDISDLHPTPINDAMPGVIIHATSIATMLSENRIKDFPEWADWVLAIVLCYIFTVSARWLRKYDWGDFVMRVIQFIILLLIIIVGTVIYIDCRVNINFTRPLLMVAAGNLAVDLWNGGVGVRTLYRNIKAIRLRRLRRKRDAELGLVKLVKPAKRR